MSNTDEMTLGEHAEAWTREQGKPVPLRETDEWRRMYEAWVEFAFANFEG